MPYCDNCDCDLMNDNEECYITIAEFDYGLLVEASDKLFCSWRCLKRWYEL